MKIAKILSLILACSCAATGLAQSVTVKLKNGTETVFSADQIEYVRFSEEQAGETVFNILTPERMPDETLRKWIDTTIANGSGVLTNEQAAEYDGAITLFNKPVKSLKGLEYFTNLTQLSIEACMEVDPATIPSLEHVTFFCYSYTGLSTVDPFALFPNLEIVDMTATMQSGSLVIANDKVKGIYCMQNDKLTSLDVSQCPNLEILACSYCGLTSLNIGECKLKELYSHENSALGSLDISGCRNTLEVLNVSNSGITALDVSNFSLLEELECEKNNLGNSLNVSGCVKLEKMRCEESHLTSLDIQGLAALRELHCYWNPLTSLDASGLANLGLLNAFGNEMTNINVDGCTSLNQLWIYENKLTRLDVSTCSPEKLEDLSCGDNEQLQEIKVWESFDMANPPQYWSKPDQAKYVYQFSE